MRRLYTFFRSSTSYRVRIALELKGLEWQPHYVSLPEMDHKRPEYLAVNPQGLVPTLVETDASRLVQSVAILEYLEEAYPSPPLLPEAPLDRAYVRSLVQTIACDIHPLNNVRVLKALRARWGLDDAGVDDWYKHWIREGFEAIEAILRERGRHGRFCLGDTVTLADVCLVPQVANAERFDCDLSAYPIARAIAERARALPEFERAHPNRQGDAF